MINQKKWRLLQLFGGEGAPGATAGGEGSPAEAAAGEESADAGHRRLRELGVPESKIRKNRGKETSALPEGALRTQPEGQAEARMTWEQILKDPEYNSELQKIIKARVKDEGRNKAILDTLEPALKQLAQTHGLDPENLDHTALAAAITGKGLPQEPTPQEQQFRSHIRNLQQQGQAMKAIIPGFDLRRELRNPLFARLTSPVIGMSVEDAFYSVHRRQMQQQSMQVAAQKTQEMISNAIRSGTHRPDETGTAAQAPSVSKFDYRNATPAQRKAIKDEIRRAAAEGRKLYPG